MPTKTLTVLILVQIGVLFLLIGKIVAIEEQMSPASHGEQRTPVNDVSYQQPSDGYASNNYFPNEDHFRRIVREELEARLTDLSNPVAQGESATAPDSVDEAENQYQLELVAQKIEYLKSIGSISDSEMHNLQTEIAKLDKAGQRKMLSSLLRAMNAGEIKGLM